LLEEEGRPAVAIELGDDADAEDQLVDIGGARPSDGSSIRGSFGRDTSARVTDLAKRRLCASPEGPLWVDT
jgi:hypothetical protein